VQIGKRNCFDATPAKPICWAECRKERYVAVVRVVDLIIGAIVILMGVEMFFVMGYRSWKWGRYIDYGPYHQVIGVIITIIGLIFLYNAIRNIVRDRRKGRPQRGRD
jgi:hypothetical protein